MVKKIDDFSKTAVIFRQAAADVCLPENYKMFILQVYSGLKRAAFFNSFVWKDKLLVKQCLRVLKVVGLPHSLIKKAGKFRIFFAHTPEDLRRLKTFYQTGQGLHLGLFLGYPSCCVKHHYSATHYRSLFGYVSQGRKALSKYGFLRADYRLNRFSPFYVVHHIPCCLGCRLTRDHADRVLALYKAYDLRIWKEAVDALKKPVLLLGRDFCIRFKEDRKGQDIIYTGIETVTPDVFFEDSLRINIRAASVVKKIESGNKIHFSVQNFQVFSRDKCLLENFFLDQPYQLLRFE